MNIKQIIVAIVGGVLICGAAHATTWYVAANGGNDSNDGKTEATAFATIQKGIDVASAHDSIIVDEGVYSPIISTCKLIHIVSKSGAGSTVIDGGGVSRCANLADGGSASERNNTVISGFTIQHGYLSADSSGAAAGVYGGTVERCVIQFCVGGGYDCGSACAHANVRNSLVVSNEYVSAWNGGALDNCEVRNCTVVDNIGYGLWDGNNMNTITWGNSKGVYINGGTCRYCLNETKIAGSGNMSGDPKFVNSEHGDYRLMIGSPCIEAGNNSYSSGDYDIAGNPRIYNGTVDIGAYEWEPQAPAGIENVIARQRYPWNGMVDIAFTLTGEAGKRYDTSFMAKDVVGGTNLSMRTLLDSNGTVLSLTNSIAPGSYKWIWNAAADLPDGFVCERVTVVGVASSCSGFRYWVHFDANGGTGTQMPDQMFHSGVSQNLSANTYENYGASYNFEGWATSPEGTAVYADKAEVVDLATVSEQVVNLYATWRVCLASGTTILLSDGSSKRVEELSGQEEVLSYDFYSGSFLKSRISVYNKHGVDNYKVIGLRFSDETTCEIIGRHGFYDMTVTNFVYLSEENWKEYVGHEFAVVKNGGEIVSAKLLCAIETVRHTGAFSVWSAKGVTCFANGVLSVGPKATLFGFGLFKVDPDKMAFDECDITRYIDEFGQYGLSDFGGLLTQQQFEDYNVKYLKIAVGRKIINWSNVIVMIRRFVK